jgi:hypothetical protein
MSEKGGRTHDRISVTFPRPDINCSRTLIVVPLVSQKEVENVGSLKPSGKAGYYNITHIFAIPGKSVFKNKLDLPELLKEGESQLIARPNQTFMVSLWNSQEQVNIIIQANRQGNLATSRMRLFAQNFMEAEKNSTNLISQVLSLWSFQFDVALDISGYVLKEETTGAQSATFKILGASKAFWPDDQAHLSLAPVRPLLSAYREALCATSEFYQAICFYKVIEGAFRLKDERKKNAMVRNERPIDGETRVPAELKDIPSLSDLDKEAVKPYLGKKFTSIRDELREIIRNAIAHLDPFGENSLRADSYDDTKKCREALPIMKYLARQLLSFEMAVRSPGSSLAF